MKKASATVIYKDNMIYNLTVNHKNSIIPLVRYNLKDSPKPYKYTCFNDLYKAVLSILKNNGFYTGFYTQFGQRWYDIQFINLDNPVEIEKFGVIE